VRSLPSRRPRSPLLAAALLLCLGVAVPAQADVSPVLTRDLTLHLARPHRLGRAGARERVRQLLEYWRSRYGVQRSWQGDRVHVKGHVMGMRLEGWLEVRDGEVEAHSTDPGWLLRGAALDYMQRKLSKYLHPTYAEP
jgi:hypothetical protein